jgi:hypothetical protein
MDHSFSNEPNERSLNNFLNLSIIQNDQIRKRDTKTIEKGQLSPINQEPVLPKPEAIGLD